MSSSVPYHLDELATVRNPRDPARLVPSTVRGESAVLDIGCGIGQMLLADELSGLGRRCGIDVDAEAIDYGKAHFPQLDLRTATAEALPFGDSEFDLVASRVALPYTDIPAALREIRRVLRPGGRFWAALHPAGLELRRLRYNLRRGSVRILVDSCYVWTNSLMLNVTGRSIARPWSGRHESVQTRSGMRRALLHAGFRDVTFPQQPGFFVVEARR